MERATSYIQTVIDQYWWLGFRAGFGIGAIVAIFAAAMVVILYQSSSTFRSVVNLRRTP